jgi:diguanylate cyclase (GGDEF)-like protein/PAS domain S-box-containing protein
VNSFNLFGEGVLVSNFNLEDENVKLRERIHLALLGYNAGIYEWNMLDDSAYYSCEWKEMLGYKEDEIAPYLSSWSDRVHPDDLKRVMLDVDKTVAKQEKSVEAIHRLKHKNGNWIWILGRGFIEYDSDAKPVKMVGIHTDITEQKIKELKMKHLTQMIEQTHESIISIDLEGNILSWNRGSEMLFGYSAKEVISKHISLLQYNNNLQDFSEIIKDLKIDRQKSREIRLKKRGGQVIDVCLSTSVLRDENDVITGIIGYIQDITDKKRAQEGILRQKQELTYQAHHDYLTNLPNRILFNDRLQQCILRSKREKSKIALFFIDLDNFKDINDTYGHDVGDKVLIEVADRISGVIRKNDTLSRLGGDEFTIILDSLKHTKDVSPLAQKVLLSLDKPIMVDNKKLHISASIGISIYPDDTKSIKDMLKFADIAMYRAKTDGRNNFKYY